MRTASAAGRRLVVGPHSYIGAMFLLAGSTAGVRADFCPTAGSVLSTTDAAMGDAPFAVRCCDLDQDGDCDLVTANDASDTVSVLLNNGDGTFADKVQWPVDADENAVSEPVDVACCDVNGDTLPDLVSVNHTSDDVSVLINTGNAQFAAPLHYPVGEAPFGIDCLDLDAQNGSDLVTNGFTEDAVSVLLNNGDGTFAPQVTYAAGDAPIAMSLCDLDGDADLDIVTANMLSKDVTSLRNNGDGTFSAIGTSSICRTMATCINPFDITCCDFDGLNGPDVATVNGIDDSIAVLFNDGSGVFGGLTFHDGTLDGPYSVTCCDVDGTGSADLISANLTSDDLTVLSNDGTGSFELLALLTFGISTSADPSSVVCCNADNDPDEDLVTTFVDGLTLFENDCTGGTCGDGVVNGDEACDDGFTDACGSCNATCTGAGTGSSCGDGVICPETEACDDGFTDACGSCNATCTAAGAGSTCGDGDACPETEACDDMGESAACDADCTPAECGDGTLNATAGEECDDGNQDPGDGCSATCRTEGDEPCGPPEAIATGGRYLTVTPPLEPASVAIQILGDPSDPDVSCVSEFVQAPVSICIGGFDHRRTCTSDAGCSNNGTCKNFADLGPDPVYLTPSEWGTVAVRGAAIHPSKQYDVRSDCGPSVGEIVSAAVPVEMWYWGDIDHDAVCRSGTNNGIPCDRDEQCTGGGVCDAVDFIDIGLIVEGFKGRFTSIVTMTACDLTGSDCLPNLDINFIDIGNDVNAFKRRPFDCTVPCTP